MRGLTAAEFVNSGDAASQGKPQSGIDESSTGPRRAKYAVAIRDGSDPWLTMWVRCSGEVFIMYPRGDRDWDAHASCDPTAFTRVVAVCGRHRRSWARMH
jgi:hypothetical protein